MSTVDTAAPQQRSALRSVAMPTEHGGWGITVEPGILGLMIAPSLSGLCLALAAVLAFLARTPLKLALVDRRRNRMLARTRLAWQVAIAELTALALLAIAAVALAEPWFWWPGLVAAPLAGIELYYDIRSRGRRMVPELAGAAAVCSVVAMIVLADGGSATIAIGAWLVLVARTATSIPSVRAQIARLHGRGDAARSVLIGDVTALALAAIAVVVDTALSFGAIAVAVVIVVQRILASGANPRPPKITGIFQMVFGFGVVFATAAGVIIAG